MTITHEPGRPGGRTGWSTPDVRPPEARPKPRRLGDRVFAGTATAAGALILLVLAGVAAFLVIEAAPAVLAPAAEIPGGRGIVAYVGPLAFGTLLAATIALLVATPLAVAVALFTTHYAPRRIAQVLG